MKVILNQLFAYQSTVCQKKTQLKYQVELIKLQDEDETSLVSEELKSSFFS